MYVNNVFIKNVLPQNGPSVFVIGGNKEYVRYYIILNCLGHYFHQNSS